MVLPGTFLVGVDVDGTLDMRPGPIAKKHLGGRASLSWGKPVKTVFSPGHSCTKGVFSIAFSM